MIVSLRTGPQPPSGTPPRSQQRRQGRFRGLPQTPHHGIEPLGPFRMFAARQVLAENRVGQQSGSWFNEE